MTQRYKTPLGYSMPLSIRVLTPVHIGGTDILSSMADYYLDNNFVNLIDSDRFSELLVQKKKVEDFMKGVERISNEKKTIFLRDFCRHQLQCELTDLPVLQRIPAIGIDNPTEIGQCIKTDGKPYLPGSSLKGAIRSALLFNWLTDETIPHTYRAAQIALDKWWEKFLAHRADDDMRNAKKIREITKAFTYTVEEMLFGKLSSNDRLPLSCLKLNDSAKVERMEIAVYGIQRFNLGSGNADIPTLKECIAPQKTVGLKINLDYDRIEAGEEKYNTIIKPLTDQQQLFEIINQYSRNVLNYEMEVLNMEDVNWQKFEAYQNHLEDLQQKIETAKGEHAYLRLGQGKMMFYQTVALALFKKFGSNEENADWVDYLVFCSDFKNDDISTPYPITRALTVPEQLPMGWVEITIA